MGRHNLDLDRRNFLHECPRPSYWYGESNAERRQLDLPTVLPHFPGQLRLLHLLLLCWHQHDASCVRLVLVYLLICRPYLSKTNPRSSIPETKGYMLEEMDTLFGGANHIDKGGDLLAVEDAHHAYVTEDVNTNDLISKQGVATVGEVRNNSAGDEIRHEKV